MVRQRGTDKVKIMRVIETEALIGEGTEKDPVRIVYQYWDFKGKFLASHDTLEDD